MDNVEGALPLRRSLFQHGLEGDCSRFGHARDAEGGRISSIGCETTPSALDLSTEDPGTCRNADLVEPPTPIAEAGDRALALCAEFESDDRVRVECTTASEIASILQFGCIGAEAVATLERVADAESWHKLNKQLNSMGNGAASTVAEWDRRVTSHYGGLLEAKDMSEYEAATDADVWANLHRQLGSLTSEIETLSDGHMDGAHRLNMEGKKRWQEEIENQDLHSKIARLEVDVQELVGDGCDVKERHTNLHEQIRCLQRHVGNVVEISDNYTPYTPIVWQRKELAPGEALIRVQEMMQQVADRARLPLLAPRVDEAMGQEVAPLSSAQIRSMVEPVALASRPGSVAGSARMVNRSPPNSATATPLCVLRAAAGLAQQGVRGSAAAAVAAPSTASGTPKVVRAVSPIRVVQVRGMSPTRSMPANATPPSQSATPTASRGMSPLRSCPMTAMASGSSAMAPVRSVSPLRSASPVRAVSPVRLMVTSPTAGNGFSSQSPSMASTAKPVPLGSAAWTTASSVSMGPASSAPVFVGNGQWPSVPEMSTPRMHGEAAFASFGGHVTLSHVPVPGSAQASRKVSVPSYEL